MKISIGADHAGFSVKEKIREYLESKGYRILDKGAYSEESVDYPEFGHAVGNSVKDGESAKGIVVCGSGIGISMAANKVEGIRAALCTTPEHALMSRLHNDANVLAIGARMTNFDVILEIVDTWLSSEFEGGRHSRRVNKIEVS
ncbi:MAG: ribose 5-phosphate isomerase B [Candidatus Marinimicrobia bacterium]|jgi:ribose 5-phosphate isomerase B|nr:ribose 5-phosphate isomerase B [Candidatus Neomarinimicrobiota bacterium]MBT6871019.1 ribose 5-phosphate isomerase B [Candidatus Neomarinimicrobiota bacterium]